MNDANPLLAVERLGIRIGASGQQVLADVSLRLHAGQTLGLAGESGSGKSMLALAIMGLLPRAAQITGGRILFEGADVLPLDARARRQLRGRRMAMIFQNPRQALNPIRSAGVQLADVLHAHQPTATRRAVRQRSAGLLEQVGLPGRLASYPFQLSGGQCQRLLIALALAGQPQLLIADEPTTGLDVRTQAAIMDLLAELASQRGLATLFISHDLALLAQRCQQVAVLHDGRLVEQLSAGRLAQGASHPYTRQLVAATPRSGMRLAQLMQEGAGVGRVSQRRNPPSDRPPAAREEKPLLQVEGLRKRFPLSAAPGRWGLPQKQWLHAVDNISFTIEEGQALGLVGESGSGKSTVALLLARLLDPDAGRILFDGQNIAATPARQAAQAEWRAGIQMVFQDPAASFNPASTVAEIVGQPLQYLLDMASPAERRARVQQALAQAGLDAGAFLQRYPHQLSGGQAARVGIARAIVPRPRLLILDEPTAALDVAVQAGVLQLLERLRREQGLSYLFVSHNLQVVQLLCQQVIVMHRGRIVERGPADALLSQPRHPYTRALVQAVPRW